MDRLKTVSSLVIALSLAGCADTELTVNTLDLASATDDLVMNQIYHNLAKFIDSDLAYPSQVVLDSGTASTTDSLQANYSVPITTAVQATRSTSSALQRTTASQTFGLQADGARTQLWSYEPVTDAFRARRLLALYRYAVDKSYDLKSAYPKIFQTVNHSVSPCLIAHGRAVIGTISATPGKQTATKRAVDVYQDDTAQIASIQKSIDGSNSGKGTKLTVDEITDLNKRKDVLTLKKSLDAEAAKQAAASDAATPPPISVGSETTRCINGISASGGGPSMDTGTMTYVTMRPDPYYMQGPQCVICVSNRSSFVNPALSVQWLHWKSLSGAPSGHRPDNFQEGDTLLGRYGHYELYAAKGRARSVPDFALFILAASTQSDTGGGGSGGGSSGGSGGGGGGGSKGGGGSGKTLNLIDANGGVATGTF